MKKIFIPIILLLAVLITQPNIFALQEQNSQTFGNLKITSFSQYWSGKLEDVYNELILNFHCEEFDYLSDIYIYPDSINGVNGYYFDDIKVGKNGYEWGKKARIEIYNADRYLTAEDMAFVLSHEYGHHYMTYNILKAENKYVSGWSESGYAQIRNLSSYDVIYNNNSASVHSNDVSEIMADDYLQLLGSPNARRFEEFDEDSPQNSYFGNIFNLKPQENIQLPLASQVYGLYSYLLNIGGYTGEKAELPSYPEITDITTENDICTIKWTKPDGDYKYTLVMYPSGNLFTPIPIKTTYQSEPSEAAIDLKKRPFEGEYIFRVYLSDSNNYIYSSENYSYSFKAENEPSIESTTSYMYDDGNTYRHKKRHNAKPENDNLITLKFTDASRISYYKRVIYI